MNSQQPSLDKNRIRASFDAAAEHYDNVAVLQRETGDRILERLDLVKLQPATILDIGAGTGVATHALSKRYKKAQVIAFDLAPNMLNQARQRGNLLHRLLSKRGFICGDAEQLPFANNSIDLIFSNAALQWCSNLDHAFVEFKRILKPDGLLMFSTFGPDTLKELRDSWRVADTDAGTATHVHNFIDMHDIGDAMLRAGLADPVMDVENFTLTYSDVHQLMRELKTLGAHNVANERRHTLTGKTRIKNMIAAYENWRINGKLPATYEVVYGHAWSPAETKNKDISIPIIQLQPGTQQQ